VTQATLRAGTANPGLIRGPGQWTINASVGKGFRVSQQTRLDVRLDAFNAVNHVNYGNPNTNVTSPDFGKLLTAVAPRSAQLSARLSF